MLRSSSTGRIFAPFLAAAGLAFAGSAGASELNLYTYREPGLIKPLVEAFTDQTGIRVNTVFAASGLEERLRAEGQNSPADVLLTVDIARLNQAKELGVTQPVRSEALERAIPAPFRDPEGHWFGVSKRARVVYASKDRVGETALAYEDLADPKWKNRICIRSGQHPYNVSLFAAMVAHKGAERTEAILKGIKANLAKKPSGGDRDVAKDIAAGACDIGLGNTYYVALMRHSPQADQRAWGEAIKVILPTFENGGTHVNISGVALAKHAPNRDNALKFMTFLVSDEGQKIGAEIVYEYPVKAGVAVDPSVAAFGTLNPDPLPMTTIAEHRKIASELVDKVGFDR